MLTVAVLGVVEARRDGDRLSVPAGKTTELLVRLALAPGSRVRVDALLDDLWPGGTGRNTLQSKVSQLRRALAGNDTVVAESDAYRLAVEPHDVDAVRADGLADLAAAARDTGDAGASLAHGLEGLALFRGEFFTGMGDWALPHRAHLEERRLGLLEDVMAARVDLGSGGELVGELETLVAGHPLRERLWSSLMTALYRGGRQADALAAYARVRGILVAELGVEPGPQLRALEQQLLHQSTVLARTPVLPPATAPGNLPAATGVLVGRSDELADLEGAVARHRLTSIIGPAGVGKTSLALETARGMDVPGGVWLVRLEAVDDTTSLEQVVAETLHVAGTTQLRARLSGAQTVLLLDNCEHVAEHVGDLAEELLEAASSLRILTTSQVPLGVEEEVVHHLEPLSLESSVALFWDRARQTRRALAQTEDAAATVEEVCRALDGLPLAIELAAARVRSLSVEEIAKRLDDRFLLLQDPTSHRPERRRALAGAIGWSYDLLFPDDQRGLWALSRFAGSAPLDGLEDVTLALGVPPGAVVDTLTRLVDRSLVRVDSAEDGQVRYRLLDSIRAYAADRLADAGLTDVADHAHAAWCARLADWCEAHVRGRSQPACVAIARAERANVTTALAWTRTHRPDLAVRIATGLGWTWVVLGDGAAAATRLRDSLSADTPASSRVSALLLAGWLEASAGSVALAEADLDAAEGVLDDGGPLPGAMTLRADLARHRAFAHLQQGRPAEALAAATTALATYRRLDLAWPTAAGLVLAAYGALVLGDTTAATRDCTEAVAILTPMGDSWGLVHATAMLGGIAQVEHRFDDAIEALTEAARESQALGFLGQAGLHLGSLARVQHRAGRHAEAARSYELALASATGTGDGRMVATARLNLARLLRSTGGGPAVVPLLEANVAWYAAQGGGDGALLSRCLLAIETADRASLDTIVGLARDEENQLVGVLALDGLARSSAEEGRREDSTRLLAEADGLHAAVLHLLDQADRPDRTAAVSALASHA